MLIAGVDPGEKAHGWALIDFFYKVPVYIDSGHFEGDGAELVEMLLARPDPPKGFAIETPATVFNLKAVKPVVATTRQGGEVGGYAKARGLPVVHLTANEWRRLLLGKGAPKGADAIVAVVVPRHVPTWPKRSNAHERDAAGVAIVAWNIEREKSYVGMRNLERADRIDSRQAA